MTVIQKAKITLEQKIVTLLKRLLSPRSRIALRAYFRWVRSLFYIGWQVECPICQGHFREFLPAGVVQRMGAVCPRCGSFERYRMLWLYLKRETDFFQKNLDLLDIAPVYSIQQKFSVLPNIRYTSIDLVSPLAMSLMDITKMGFADNSFDCIICYSVLECVPEDQKAMQELFRILRPGGWALIHIFLDTHREKTYEDFTILEPDQREQVFGGRYQVRIYGNDYFSRLRNAGFTLCPRDYVSEVGTQSAHRYGLNNVKYVFHCSKPVLQ